MDPRAVRSALGPSSTHAGVAPLVLEPAAIPLAPAPRTAGAGLLGGIAPGPAHDQPGRLGADAPPADLVFVDGEPFGVRLVRRDESDTARLDVGHGPGAEAHRVVILEPDGPRSRSDGIHHREVLIGGWRVEVEVELERRAALRERASRGRQATVRGGPTEVRAIIPGRVLTVSVVAGDDVVAGQQLLAVEAMKMQNELRAPRDGRIERVAVAAGQTTEVGDLLLVID